MLKRAYRLRISISSRSSRCCLGGGGGEGEEDGLGGARIMPVLVSNSIKWYVKESSDHDRYFCNG